MTRINRQDTLLTELRDIKRRLRLLEAARMRQPPPALSQTFPPEAEPAAVPVPFLPTRPIDWPATTATDWETLSEARVTPGGRTMVVRLHAAAGPGTTGLARVLVDGRPIGAPLPVSETPLTSTIPMDEGAVLTVQARRVDGNGLIHVAALLHT